MSTVVVVGAQWGDEGKGKIVDLLAENSHMVVRYAGGPNAGHTLVVNGKKTVLRLIPSGILHKDTICVMSQGMVIDPLVLNDELQALTESGIDFKGRLFISDAAHLIMPYHIEIDKTRESRIINPIGTTKKGIGPVYEDKVARRGIRLGELKDVFEAFKIANNSFLHWTLAGYHLGLASNLMPYLQKAADIIVPFLIDTSKLINDAIRLKKKVLFEGAQGTLLDVDHGTYPYVTSSSAIAGGACTGTGVGPSRINKVLGITKAYSTRVGAGPFPTEIEGELADRIRTVGNEFGSVTKRPRRVGWLDLPALKYAAQVNGLDGLVVTKLDTLSQLGLQRFYVRTNFDHGVRLDEPKLQLVDGWEEDLSQAKSLTDLPYNTRSYLEMIENEVEVPVWMASVGPERSQTISVVDFWN
jgi:adenylosuccinate synthase